MSCKSVLKRYNIFMKERYTYIEPVKKGVKVASLVTQTVYEAVEPRVKRRMIRNVAKLLRVT